EDLNRCLDRRRIVELAAAHRLAKRAAGHVLIGDVHMLRIAPESVGPLTGGMAEPRGRLRLALGARGGLALARDDPERDVDPVLFAACGPHGARAAASQRLQGPIPSKDELALEDGWGGVRHQLSWVGQAVSESCPAESLVRVTTASAGSCCCARTAAIQAAWPRHAAVDAAPIQANLRKDQQTHWLELTNPGFALAHHQRA